MAASSGCFKGCLLAIFALVIVPTVCVVMMPDTPDRPSSTPPPQDLTAQFEAGINGNMPCPQLFEIRNKLRRGKPEDYQERLNEKLRSVGCYSSTSQRTGSTPQPSTAPTPQPRPSSNLTLTFDDGSKLELTNVRNIQDGACGPRRMARFAPEQGGGEMEVMVYLNRKGEVVSIRVPQAGNQAIYGTEGIECLMNWETNRMEYMTEAEYKKHEKAAGK